MPSPVMGGSSGGGGGGSGPSTLFSSTTAVGNVDTSETDLHTHTISAGALASNGYAVRARYAGSIANSGNVFKVYFAGTAVFSHTVSAVAAGWDLDVLCVRASSTSVKCTTSFQANTASNQNRSQQTTVTGIADLGSNTAVIKMTGTGAFSSDEMILELAHGQLIP